MMVIKYKLVNQIYQGHQLKLKLLHILKDDKVIVFQEEKKKRL